MGNKSSKEEKKKYRVIGQIIVFDIVTKPNELPKLVVGPQDFLVMVSVLWSICENSKQFLSSYTEKMSEEFRKTLQTSAPKFVKILSPPPFQADAPLDRLVTKGDGIVYRKFEHKPLDLMICLAEVIYQPDMVALICCGEWAAVIITLNGGRILYCDLYLPKFPVINIDSCLESVVANTCRHPTQILYRKVPGLSDCWRPPVVEEDFQFII